MNFLGEPRAAVVSCNTGRGLGSGGSFVCYNAWDGFFLQNQSLKNYKGPFGTRSALPHNWKGASRKFAFLMIYKTMVYTADKSFNFSYWSFLCIFEKYLLTHFIGNKLTNKHIDYTYENISS